MKKKISAFVTSLTLLASSTAVMPSFSASAVESLPSNVDLSIGEDTAAYFPNVFNQGTLGSCTACSTTYYQFSYEVRRKMGIKDKSFAYSPLYTYNLIDFGDNTGSNIENAYYLLRKNGPLTIDKFGYDSYPDVLSTKNGTGFANIIQYISKDTFDALPEYEQDLFEVTDELDYNNKPLYRRQGLYLDNDEYKALPEIEKEYYIGVAGHDLHYRMVNSFRINPNRTNPDDIFDSLNMRLANYENLGPGYDIDDKIYNLSDDEIRKIEDKTINSIKEKLNEGKMVLTSGNFTHRESNGNDSVIYKNNNVNSGHAYNIIGYDDNYEFTTPQGVKMVGAFKILNSWGEEWGDKGFAWVMYDAFHIKSDYDNMNYSTDYWEYNSNTKKYEWVSEPRTRSFSDNNFYVINVEEKQVKLVSEVEVLTNNSYAMVNDSFLFDPTYKYYPSKENDDENESIKNWYYSYGYNLISNKSVFNGSLYNDITDLSYDGKGNNHSYTIKYKNIDPKDTHFIVKAIRIKDNKGNVVSEKINGLTADDFFTGYNNGARCEAFDETFDINLPKGDLNYDGVLDQNDFTKIDEYFNIINYRNSDEAKNNEIKEKFSSFQLELLDANDDNEINMNDYNKLKENMNS